MLSFKRDDYIDGRLSFSEYFMPKVEINVFNVLIDGKSFFDVPLKNKEEHTKKLLKLVKIIIKVLVTYFQIMTN